MMRPTEPTEEFTDRQTLADTPHGTVIRATSVRNGREVTLKLRSAPDIAAQRLSLKHELEVLQRLDSPLVVKASELCESDGRPCLVCEYVPGQSLGEARESLTLTELLHVAIRVATALSHLHERGVTHNDIKPSNILYDSATGGVTLIDFELAVHSSQPRAECSGVEGSLPYLPPERTGRMNRVPDYRADFYSLGITLFELASGGLPFEATDALGWAHAHLSKQPPLLSELAPHVPGTFAELVTKLMAKNPEQRYQSAFGLLSDLKRCYTAWSETGNIPPFQLGLSDVSQVLHVSRELVGRDSQLRSSQAALTHAKSGRPTLLTISGGAGSGKSALCRRIAEQAASEGYLTLLSGFEQHNHGRPYAALVSAFETLVDTLLIRSEAELEELQQRLNAALGINTAVIVDFVPRLAQVLGPQTAPTVVSPTEAKHRLQAVVRAFLRAFASADQPLLLGLDDSHWMDPATGDLICDLLVSGEIRHLAVVVSHRDDRCETRALQQLVEAARNPDIGVEHLATPNLDRECLTQLVSASLGSLSSGIDSLVRVIHEKTDGNPFFVTELLQTAAADGVFILDGTEGKWTWDLERLRQYQVAANVAELVTQRLDRLTGIGQRVLAIAACAGQPFDAKEIALVADLTSAEVATQLWQAAAEKLIVRMETHDPHRLSEAPRFTFVHPRVLDAAYSKLDVEVKERVHSRLGRIRLETWKSGHAGVALFDVLHHLNLASGLTPSEAEQLIALNLEGTEVARRTAAFDIALGYAQIASDLTRRHSERLSKDLVFRARFLHAEATYLTGEFAAAGALCDQCFTLADTPLSRARIRSLKARIADHQADLAGAISEIRAGLAELGVALPETQADIDGAIGPGLAKMVARLSTVEIEDLAHLPVTDNPETALVLELLMQVVPPSIQTYPPLFIVAELMMFDLELERGVTAVSCKNFVDCAILQSSILGNQDAAFRLGRVAFSLLERFKPTPLEAAVTFVYAAFVSHWKAHYREADAAFEKLKRVGVELGDLPHVAYAYAHHTQRSISVGRTLSDCARELEEALHFLTRGRHFGPIVGTKVAARAVARLCADAGDEATVARDDADATAMVLDSRNAQWGYSYGQAQTMVSFILRDRAAARYWQAFTKPFSLAAASLFSVPDYHLFNALIDLWCLDEVQTPGSVLTDVDATLEKLEGWANASPANFRHKFELLRAERDRVRGEPLHTVLQGYERTVASAGRDFPHLRALTHELEAELWLSRGDARRARPALEEAHRLYTVWGATAKTRQLERNNAWLKLARTRDESLPNWASRSTTTTTSSSGLDAESILKATQAISKEVETKRLFSTLMTTLIESAGAEYGCLILESDVDHQNYVEASASIDGRVTGECRRPLEETSCLCSAVVRYVLRSKEAVALDDACNQGAFQNDEYIKINLTRSLLCVPIQRQGKILGALYLENNQTTHAFTRDRIGLLQVIASQAAISIYNAQLYGTLERRVQERTAELGLKNRQIASMLDNMEQGVFTINKDLAIEPGYSRQLAHILGTADIAGQNCMQLLFGAANVRPDLLQAAGGALQFSFGVESWLADTNADHLIREYQRTNAVGEIQCLEVDWNFICDDQDLVDRVLVVVRDVTALRRLQQTAAERGQEADVVTQIIETGVDSFHEFADLARTFIEENAAALARSQPLTEALLISSFRNLHTLKGNARLLGYTHLVDSIHAAEEPYDAWRRGLGADQSPDALSSGLTHVAKTLAFYESVCEAKLSKLSHTHDRRHEQLVTDIKQLLRRRDSNGHAGTLDEVAYLLERFDGKSLSELVIDTSRLVPSLAQELQRSTPVVECLGGDHVVTREWAGSLRDILVQCFRNALFHGIESEVERTTQGKPATGKIWIQAKRVANGLEIELRDDGRGLAVERLRDSAERASWNDDQLAACVFESGVSTAQDVGLVAGRGVGLDIVRAALRRRGGGDAAIRFNGPEHEGFRPFSLVFVLPRHAIVDSFHGPAESAPSSAAAE